MNAKLSLGLEAIVLKCLEKDPGSRYSSAREIAVDLHRLATPSAADQARVRKRRRRWLVWPLAAALLVAAGAAVFLHTRRVQALTEQDTIVVGDFDNRTGEAVFDDALKEALSMQLEQSPFLNAISPVRIKQTLAMMGRPAHERLNEVVGREVCQRTESKALLSGSIASLGSQYILGLKAVACASGDVLVQEQVQVGHKEEVLDALGKLASRLRGRLGESLNSVRKFDTPIAEATTSSLEALQGYSLALKAFDDKGNDAAIPFLKRAIELDANFAMAYARLGNSYDNLGHADLADDNYSKAYALRNRMSEIERFYIESHYYLSVSGEFDKAIQVFQLWIGAYPRSIPAHVNLGVTYFFSGQYEQAVVEEREALRLFPNGAINYGNLAEGYIRLNRFDEAEQLIREAEIRKLGGEFLLEVSYLLAFFRADQNAMQHVVAEAMGQGEAEHMLLAHQSETEAYYGRLKKARERSRRAQESARRIENQEAALNYQIEAALWEGELGNRERGAQELARLLPASSSRQTAPLAALVCARISDANHARNIMTELGHRYPRSTLIHYYWLPVIEATAALRQNDSGRALEELQTVSPYELADGAVRSNVGAYPIYLRGEAYLMAGDAAHAIAEFQKVTDHPGIVENSMTGPLAYLGLGRAYAQSGDAAKARQAYEHLLRLWQNADPDIPLVNQAKTEYANLR